MPEVTLQNLKIALSKVVREDEVRYRLGSYSEEKTEFDVYKQAAEELRMGLVTKVLAGRAVSDSRTFTLRYPATWWQHFKQDGRPRWLLRRIKHRWPVRMAEANIVVDFTSYDTFPRADVPIPANDAFGYSVRWDEYDWLTSGPVVITDDSGLSPSRQFVPPRQLTQHLINRVLEGGSVHLQSRSVSETISRLFGAWDNTGGLGILGSLGVNTAQLVRMGRLEEDMRSH